MNNNENLRDELLRQDGIEPVGVTNAERAKFRAMLTKEERRVGRIEWIIHIPLWVLTVILLVTCFSERLLETLDITLDVALSGLVLVVFGVLVPISFALLYGFKSRKAKLKKIQGMFPEYAGRRISSGFILTADIDGKPLVRWPAVITVGMTLSLVMALVIGATLFLLADFADYPSVPLMVYSGFMGIAIMALIVYQGLRTGVEKPSKLTAKQPNIWKVVIKSRITRFSATVAIGLILISTYVAKYEPDPQNTVILGQASLYSGSFASIRVLVRNHATGRPIQNAAVRLTMEGDKVKEDLGKFMTDEDGSLSKAIYIPSVPSGRYNLVIESKSQVGKDHIVTPIELKRPYRLYVTTDKPVYQPGQTIHMRAIVLNRVSLKPFAKQSMLFEIEDPKGNKVFKSDLITSEHGIASADFDIANEVNLGRYRIRAIAGDVETEKVVTVKHYVLPKFKVEVSTNKPYYLPSEELKGVVTASYFFGKPVANSQVELTGRTIIEEPVEIFKITGLTNGDGEFAFHTELADYFTGMPLAGGNAFLEIEALVTDTAGHEEKTSEHRVVAQQPINIHVIPESGDYVQGVENIIYIMTAYPDGQAATCQIEVNGSLLTADVSGIAVFRVKSEADGLTLNIKASDDAGNVGTLVQEVGLSEPSQDFLLRTDKAVYFGGETIEITVLSATPEETFFLDVIKDGQTMLTKTLPVEKGRGEISIDLSPGLFGTLKLNAYTIKAEGESTADSRIVHVHQPNQLQIHTSMDKAVYRPGETAQVDFRVLNEQGIPTPAALSLSAVDEAVFYIGENRPGLLEQFFLADEELLRPAYQIKFFVSPDKLLSGEDEYQQVAMALFCSSAPAGDGILSSDQVIDKYFGPGMAEKLRENMGEEQYNKLLENLRQRPHADALIAGDDYTLRATTYPRKSAQAEAFREQYFAVLVTAVIVLVVAGFVVSLFYALFYSTFRLLKAASTEGLNPVQAAVQKATNGFVYSYAMLLLFPIVTYLSVMFLSNIVLDFYFYINPGIILFGALAVNVLLVVILIVSQFRWGLALARFPETVGAVGKLLALPVLFTIQYIITRMIIIYCMCGALDGEFGIFAVLASFALSSVFYIAADGLAGRLASKCQVQLKRTGGFSTVVTVIAVMVSLGYMILMPCLSRVRYAAHSGPMMLSEAPFSMITSLSTNGLEVYNYRQETTSEDKLAEKQPETGKIPPRVRRYFPETLLWYPELITDENGEAALNVTTADSITSWRMNVDAVSVAGRLGSSEVGIRVFQDFFVDLDLPVALTRNDEVSIPVACYNYLQQQQTVQLRLEAGSWCELQGPSEQEVNLAPNEVKSVMFRIKAKDVGSHELTLVAHGDKLSDAVQRRIDVRPDGSLIEDLQAGTLAGATEHKFYIPQEAIPNSQGLILKLYPSTFSEVVEGLENIFRMPFGCFEQTSSTTYPNVMALLYMKQTNQVTPEIEVKARKFITAGYQRLLTFEVPGGGFDWFGHAPANETLTAYGILELTDMSKVHNVDEAVINRASQWLMSKQQSDGSWKPAQWHDISDDVKATAYIAWALAEAGQHGEELDTTFAYLRQHLKSTDNAYTVALAANAFLTCDDRDAFGGELVGRLRSQFQVQGDSAYISTPGTGAIYSRGRCLDIETTALATLAMMKANRHPDTVRKALTWISQQKDQYGTWYSTQATILAMKAIIAGTGQALSSDTPSNIEVTINGEWAGRVRIIPDSSDLLHMMVLTDHLRSGENTIHISQDEIIEIPYRLIETYWIPEELPVATPEKELDIQVDYDRNRLAVDDVLRCTVEVTRIGETIVNMAIIDLGIPPGFKVDVSAFNRLVEARTLAKYELTGNQCILYVRSIKPGQPLRFSYELKALYPIRAKIPPTRVYEYYRPESEDHTVLTDVLVEEI